VEIDSSETLVPVAGGSRFPRKGGTHPPYYTLSHPRTYDHHLHTLYSSSSSSSSSYGSTVLGGP
jgi:hypothetical protein